MAQRKRGENMEPMNSTIDPAAKVFKDTYIRDSIVGKAVISDRAVLINSVIGDKVEIGRDCNVVYASFGFGSYIGNGSVIKFTRVGKYSNMSWHLSIGGSNHNYHAACMYTESWWKRTFGVGDGLIPVREDAYTVIGNDTWIGAQANILRGVSIGDGAVIGANALVLHDVPPYAIAVGSPAKVIKYRFDEKTIERLQGVRWWDWPIETIRAASEYLHGDLNEEKLRRLEAIAGQVSSDERT